MSAQQYRNQLERKRKQRSDADQKVGEFRSKESAKRAEAAALRHAAAKTKSETTARSKLRDAERRENEAARAGREANRWQSRATGYTREESQIRTNLERAERSEAEVAERKRRTEDQRASHADAKTRSDLQHRLVRAESVASHALRELRAPKPEKVRVLILGASADGGLRVGREQQRIRAAVQSALHRDHIELDARPAATTGDLLDGVSRFRPHVVHFSGHSDEHLILFEDDVDAPHQGVIVTATAFANAVRATDDPPQLVLLNSCKSARQLDHLIASGVAPHAIGMADSIGDVDAIVYAAQFYASAANGQSVGSAHAAGRSALELGGLDGSDLPTLRSVDDVNPWETYLVRPPEPR